MLNLPRAVHRGGASNARATSCFAGAGDGLASKLQRLHEGRPDSFLSLAALVKEDPAARGRAIDGVATASALLGQCGTLLGDDARERSRAALFFLATLCSPPEPGAAQRLSERQHAALLGYASEARSACAQHHVVRRCVVASLDELACGRTAKIRSRESITVETLRLLAHLSRRGNGAQDARDAVAAYDVEPFLVAVRAQACDGTLPRDWKSSLLSGCDELEQCYHVCRRDANVAFDQYARQAMKRPFLALAVEARSKLHAFATTKGRVELGAEKAAAEASKALRALVKEVAEDTKDEVAADDDQKAKASELRSAGKRGAAFDVERERSMRRAARARAAAFHGGAAAATAALRRFSQLRGGRMAHGALDEARCDVREAACEVYAVLQTLGDFGDGEDAAQAGPLLLTMLEDGASRSISHRSRIQGVARVWFALEALLSGDVASEPRLRIIDALRGRSSAVADLAAASLVGDGGPRDLALHDEARSSLRVVAALVPPGSDQLKPPTALRIAIACEAVAQSTSELVGLAIRVLLVVAQRTHGATRDLLERRADALDADAEEPYYKACGLLRIADDDKKLAEALVLLRDAAPEAGRNLAEAGAAGLLLDILRDDDGAAKKATTAIKALEAVGAVAKASYACRILIAAEGAADAVRIASKYENVPGVAKAVIDGLTSLFSDGDVDGEALDTADDVDEDDDPDTRLRVRETAVVVSAGRCARFVVNYAAKARQNALHFSGGVSDTKAIGDEAQASGLRCLNALLATRDRRNMFADRGPPDTENRNELRRYRARRAAHSAARRLLAKDLRGAAGTIGDFLERAQLNFNQPNDATDAALEAFKRCHPRDVWKGEIFRGVEVGAWLASKRGQLGEDCLIQTVACCWDTRHILPQGCLEVFINVAASGREGLERAAPALETLYGKEADKGQHAEALEGFSWTTGKKELGAIPCGNHHRRVVVSVAASARWLVLATAPARWREILRHRRDAVPVAASARWRAESNSLVDVHTGAMERQQALLAAARKALHAPAPQKAEKFSPVLSDDRAWLPFQKPPPPSDFRGEDSFFRPGTGGSRPGTGASARSRPGTGASGRSSLMSRGSTADGIRLLMAHAPKIELPPPPKSSMSRRLHPLPRRAPKKVQVNVPLPNHARVAAARRRERQKLTMERDERSRAAAKHIVDNASSELPSLKLEARVPQDHFANKLRRANENLGALNELELRHLRSRCRVRVGQRVSTAGRRMGRDLIDDAAGAMNMDGFRAAVEARKRKGSIRRRAAGGGYF